MPFDTTPQTRPSHCLTFEQACEIVSGASRDLAFTVSAATPRSGSALPPGVTLIPHTDAGRYLMRSVLRGLGPAGIEYRHALVGVENWLAAHRRRQGIRRPNRFHGTLAQSRALVLTAVARARRARSALIVSGVSQ